jgi:hypothetical protein
MKVIEGALLPLACGDPLDTCLLPDALIPYAGSSAIFPLFTPEAFFSRGNSLKRPGA